MNDAEFMSEKGRVFVPWWILQKPNIDSILEYMQSQGFIGKLIRWGGFNDRAIVVFDTTAKVNVGFIRKTHRYEGLAYILFDNKQEWREVTMRYDSRRFDRAKELAFALSKKFEMKVQMTEAPRPYEEFDPTNQSIWTPPVDF